MTHRHMPATPRTLKRVGIALSLGLALLAPDAVWAQKNFDQPPQLGRPQGSTPQGSTSTDSRNPRFTLINDSPQIIDNLNISPANDDSWGDDLLGNLALPSHSRIIAGPTQDTGCSFDVRVVYHDHREEILRRQNLCDLPEISFTGKTHAGPGRNPRISGYRGGP